MGLQEKLKQLEQHRKEKEEKEEKDAQKTVTLPMWPASKRACPSVAFRSALFPALGRGPRPMLDDAEIFAVGPVTVRFTGRQLDQETDLTIYLELLHHFNGQQSDHVISITAYALLKSLGRTLGSSGYQWLDASFKRLTSGTIEITAETRSQRYRGHLIESTNENLATGAYKITLNRDFAAMFSKHWSSLDIAQRRNLKTPTAQAFHAYFSSHYKPGFHRFDTLAAIAGLSDSNPRRLKIRIRGALQQLVEIGFATSIEATNDGVAVHVKSVDN